MTWEELKDKLEIARASDEHAHIKLYNERGETQKIKQQLKEAQEVIKLYANTTIGEKQKDGTYMYTDYLATFFSTLAPPTAIYYDPRPAKKWLKKWGVK